MNCPATRRRRALILTTFLPAILSLFFLTDLELAQAQNGPPVNAPTFHYDRQRTGWNSSETWLTPTNVAGSGFGPLWNSPVFDSVTVSGTTYPAHMFATPLYIDSVQISAGTYAGSNFNVVYAATTNNFIYAVNAFPSAGSPSVPAGTILWKTSLGTPANLASLGSPNGLDGGVALGVLGTPIIDMNATPPTLYVAAQTATATDTNWRVFALDITSGNILPGWPLTITNAALAPINQNGPAAYQPTGAMSQRGALNLSLDGKLLYVSYGAYGDDGAGWMIIVDTTVPSLSSAWSGAPSQVSYANGGMWGSGGPAIDSSGIVYDVSGNSPDGSENSPEVWGESALSWNPGTPLVLRSTYTPWNYCLMDTNDTDIAGTPLVIDLDPSVTSTPHLIAFGSKQGNAYLLDRNNMKGNLTSRPPCASTPATDTSLYGSAGQSYYNGLPGPLNVFGPYTETCVQGNDARMRTTPAYFKRADGADIVYFSGATKALACSQTPVPPGLVRLRLVTTAGQPAYYSVDAVDSVLSLFSPGPPIVTSNGSSNAIVWVLDANVYRADSLVGSGVNHPVLYALDANTMQLLWKSSSSQLDVGGKYNHVVVARGSVFVGTDRIQAFGIPGAPVSLGVSGVSFNPPTVLGGNSSTGTVTLNGVAPTGGATVTLSTNNSAAVTIPASVIVPQGLGTATFPIVTNPVTAQTPVSISASLNSTTQSATLTVNPLLASLTLNPAILVGGSSSTGTVTLNAVAPSGGITVNLSSNNGNAQPPLSVNVAGGSATATFTVTTSVVASATNATISASYNGATLSAGLGINPTGVASFVRAAGNSAESVKYTVSITPTAGDFLGVFVFQIEAAATPAAMTDNLGTVYTKDCDLTYNQGSGVRRLTVYHLLNAPSGITGISVTPNKPSRTIVAEYSGMPASGAVLDLCGTVNNQTSAVTSWFSTATTTTASDLVFGIADTKSTGNGGYQATGLWTGRLVQHDTVDADDSFVEDQINVASGVYTATGTTTISVDESSVVVAFKANLGPVSPKITSANSATFAVGSVGTFAVTATGTTPIIFTETGALPSPVVLSSTGVLSGTPATGTAGTYPITITAANGTLPNATQNFTLTVGQAPAITSANSTTFTVGAAGTFAITATGTPAPTFTETGALPSGVTLATTGVLSGTPAAGTGGTYTFTVTAQNGATPNATQSFTLTVNQAAAITSAASTTFTIGTAGTFTVTATGFPVPTIIESGTLPSLVAFNNGVLSGTPAAGTAGGYPISFTASNGVGAPVTQNFTLNVNSVPVAGPIAFVRAAGNTGESVKYTVSITPTAGDFLGVFVFQIEAAATPAAMTDNLGTVYTKDCDLTYNQGSGVRRLTVYHLLNAPSGITGISVTPNKPSRTIVAEYSGMPASGAVLDLCGTVNNQTSAVTSWTSTATTTTATDVVFGIADTKSSGNAGYNASGLWTGRLAEHDTVDADDSYLEDQVAVPAGVYTATGTSTVSVDESSVVVAFRTIAAPPSLTSVAVSPTSVVGGSPSTGTVTLNAAAATGGTTVTLTDNNAAASEATSLTVPAGATTATFPIATTPVGASVSVTVSGTLGTVTKTATLTVNPPALSTVSVSPTSVKGGTSSTGTVTLTGAAPAAGTVVTLTDNNAAASEPASVTVPAGATTATFTITTTTVTSSRSVRISGSLNGTTKNATLTVTP